MNESDSGKIVLPPRLKNLARILDELFVIPGTNIRIGLDAIVGLLPGLGDIIGALFSAYFIYNVALLGVPTRKLGLMIFNVLIDTIVGAVPMLGDIFDIGWKANRKNVALVEAMDVSALKPRTQGDIAKLARLFALGLFVLILLSAFLIGWALWKLFALL